MRVARGFRQAVTRGAAQHMIDGGDKTDPVPDRDINRFHTRARAQYRADDLVIVHRVDTDVKGQRVRSSEFQELAQAIMAARR